MSDTLRNCDDSPTNLFEVIFPQDLKNFSYLISKIGTMTTTFSYLYNFQEQVSLSSSSEDLPADGEKSMESNGRISKKRRSYVDSVDFGTNSVRCFLYDQQGKVRSSASERVILLYNICLKKKNDIMNESFCFIGTQITQLYPHQGWNEIDPEEVWTKFQNTFKSALRSKFFKILIF